jgi:hypothetical protein
VPEESRPVDRDLLVFGGGLLRWVEASGRWVEIGRVISVLFDRLQEIPERDPETAAAQARLDAVQAVLDEPAVWEQTWGSRAHRDREPRPGPLVSQADLDALRPEGRQPPEPEPHRGF